MHRLVCSSAKGNSSSYRIAEELPQGGIGCTSMQEFELGFFAQTMIPTVC
jgi:hypothetical protein